MFIKTISIAHVAAGPIIETNVEIRAEEKSRSRLHGHIWRPHLLKHHYRSWYCYYSMDDTSKLVTWFSPFGYDKICTIAARGENP